MKNFIANHPVLWSHVVSATKTFIAGFVVGILPYLNNLDWANLGKGALFGIFLAGIRAGVKVLWEQVILPWVVPAPTV